jgi:Protein of unknown function (DUF2521).
MGSVLNFQEKLHHKQQATERRALQDLTFDQIEKSIRTCFDPLLSKVPGAKDIAAEMCAEYALEAFLLGSAMSRFGYYGEERTIAFQRSRPSFDKLLTDFSDFWEFWSDQPIVRDEIFPVCRVYLNNWWTEGFDRSLKRRKMKLH